MSGGIISEETQRAVQEHLNGNLHKYSNADPQILSEYIGALLTRTQNVEALHQSFLSEMKEFMKENTENFVHDLFQFLATREPHLFRSQFGANLTAARNAAKGFPPAGPKEDRNERNPRRPPRRVLVNQAGGKKRARRFDFGPPKGRHRDRHPRRGREGRTYSRSRSRTRSRSRSRTRSKEKDRNERDRERTRDRRGRRRRKTTNEDTVNQIYHKLLERLASGQPPLATPGIPMMAGAALPLIPQLPAYGRALQHQRIQEQRLAHRRANRMLRPHITSSDQIQQHIQQQEAARRLKESQKDGDVEMIEDGSGQALAARPEAKDGEAAPENGDARMTEKDKNALLDASLDDLRLPAKNDTGFQETRYTHPMQQGGQFGNRRFVRRRLNNQNGRSYGYPNRRETQLEDKRQIVINNIPSHLCGVVHLTTFFSQFGDIENIQQHKDKNRAFVQFSKHEEALAALESSEPVLGEPDVEVRWAYFNRPDFERNARMGSQNFSSRPPRRSFGRNYGDATGSGLTDAVINGIPQDQFRQKKNNVNSAMRNLRAENKNRWFAPGYAKKHDGSAKSAKQKAVALSEVDKVQESISSLQSILKKELDLLEQLDAQKPSSTITKMKKDLVSKIQEHQECIKDLMKQQTEKLQQSMGPSMTGSPRLSPEKATQNLPSKILLVSKWAKYRTLSEADFRVHFQRFGDVKSVELLSNHAARVEFHVLESAVASYRNGRTFENIEFEIQYADPIKCASKFSQAIPSMWSDAREDSIESVERDVIAIDDDDDDDDDQEDGDVLVNDVENEKIEIEISDDDDDETRLVPVDGEKNGHEVVDIDDEDDDDIVDVSASINMDKSEENGVSKSETALQEMANITAGL